MVRLTATATLGQGRASAENRLALLLAKAPMQFRLTSIASWEAPSITLPAYLPAAVLETRPDIAAMSERVRAANARIGEARAARLPQLTLTGAAGYASDALSKLIRGDAFEWSWGPALQLVLFDGGRLHARVEQARAQANQARLDYRQTALRAFEDVENALASITAARTREQAAVETRQSLGKSTSLLQTSSQSGAYRACRCLLPKPRNNSLKKGTQRAAGRIGSGHITHARTRQRLGRMTMTA